MQQDRCRKTPLLQHVSPLVSSWDHIKILLIPAMEAFPHPKRFSVAPAVCSTMCLNSNTMYQCQIVSDLTGQWFHPTRLPSPPFQMPFENPDCHLCFSPTSYKSEVPMSPSLVQLIGQSGSQNSGKQLSYCLPVCYEKISKRIQLPFLVTFSWTFSKLEGGITRQRLSGHLYTCQ